jgi:hypothetical protein
VRASIIIVNYNGGSKLVACLQSFQGTATPSDEVEVIVWDNASTDGSVDEIEKLFPWVKLTRSDQNLGFAVGNNRAVELAQGQLLVFLNPDTIVQPGWLEPLLDDLEQDPSIGMVTSKLLLKDGRINACGNDIHLTGLTLCRGMGRPDTEYTEQSEISAVSGAAFVMRRDFFSKLGGFDEDMFLYMEDIDLSWRVQLAGYRCFYEPRSRVMHDYTLRFGPRKVFYQERNRYLMLLKALRWRTLITLIPALILAEFITWGFVITRDRSNWKNKFSAYWWVVRHWGRVLSKRHQTQSFRHVSDQELLQLTVHALDFGQVSQGIAGKSADSIFNPIFRLMKRCVLVSSNCWSIP